MKQRGFSLIEVLVAIAIIAVLIGLLQVGMSQARGAARSFKCQMAQRSLAFDFSVFADSVLHGDRGDDESLGDDRFRIETFQESLYGIDEYWRWNGDRHAFPDTQDNDPMRCAEVMAEMVVRRGLPCSRGAISPPESVSFGFNLRLHRDVDADRPRIVDLRSNVLDEPMLALAWDVDGAIAKANDVSPVYSAPRLDNRTVMADDQYWFPARRHNGSTNVVFIDGHVDSSGDPLSESSWVWRLRR